MNAEPAMPRNKSRFKQLQQLLAWPIVLLVGYFWWQSIRQLDLAATLTRVRGNEGLVGIAIFWALLYLIGQAVVWRRIVGDLVVKVEWKQGIRLWMISNIARYLPGSIWHLVGRIYMGQGAGVNRARGALSVMLEQALQLLSALLLVALSTPFWPPESVVRQGQPFLLLLPVGLLAIHPRLFLPFLNRLLARGGYEPVGIELGYGRLLGYLLRYLSLHLANGLSLAFAVLALGAGVGIERIPAIMGGALFAWTVGYLSILTPGGLGLREMMVTVVLAPIVTVEIAALAALLWRAASIVAEALGALLFDLLVRTLK